MMQKLYFDKDRKYFFHMDDVTCYVEKVWEMREKALYGG